MLVEPGCKSGVCDCRGVGEDVTEVDERRLCLLRYSEHRGRVDGCMAAGMGDGAIIVMVK